MNMTHIEMLQKLIAIGEDMRAAQRGFFRTKEKSERQEFLIKAKKHEAEFDNALFNIKQLMK